MTSEFGEFLGLGDFLAVVQLQLIHSPTNTAEQTIRNLGILISSGHQLQIYNYILLLESVTHLSGGPRRDE